MGAVIAGNNIYISAVDRIDRAFNAFLRFGYLSRSIVDGNGGARIHAVVTGGKYQPSPIDHQAAVRVNDTKIFGLFWGHLAIEYQPIKSYNHIQKV